MPVSRGLQVLRSDIQFSTVQVSGASDQNSGPGTGRGGWKPEDERTPLPPGPACSETGDR